MTTIDTVVVTRHPALLEYLREKEIVGEDVRVIAHATPDDVRGKRVIGVLPHHLSSLADSVTEVELNVPAELRGVELTLEQVREYARSIRTYRVQEVRSH